MFIKSFNNNNDSNIIMLSKAKRTIKYRKFKKKISKKKDLKPKLDLERNSMKFNIYKKVLVLIFILIFAGGSIIFWLGKEQLDTMNLNILGIKTVGKVTNTALYTNRSNDNLHTNRSKYKLYIEFKNENGKIIKLETDFHRVYSKYNKNDEVTVIYDPKNLNNAKVYSFNKILLAIIMLIVNLIAFIVLPIYLILFDCIKKLRNLNNFNNEVIFIKRS